MNITLKSIVGDVSIFILLAVLVSQMCEIPRKSPKIGTQAV